MSTVTNPLAGLINGLLQGHELAMQMRRAQDEHRAALLQDTLHNTQMSVQDMFNEQYLREKGGRPVNNGMIEEPGGTVPGMESPEPGLLTPGAQQVGGIVRKAGGNGRFVQTLKKSNGESVQYEMPSIEEQQALQTQRELTRQTTMMRGQATAEQDLQMELRKRMLSTPGLTVSAPPGLEMWGYAPGAPILKGELPNLLDSMQKYQKGYWLTTKPGETVYDMRPAAPAAPAAAPQYSPTEFNDFQVMGGSNPQGQAVSIPGTYTEAANRLYAGPGPQASPSAPAAGPRVIAQGGAPLPKGDFATIFLPAYAAKAGKKVADLSPEQMLQAREEYTGATGKQTEANLAWTAIHGQTPAIRDMADKALKRLDQSKQAARPVNYINTGEGQDMLRDVAKSLANGDLTRLKDITSLRGDQRLRVYAMAKQMNPNFSTADVDRQIKMEDYYTNGKGANNLQSFGTFLQHGGAAMDAIGQIKLSSSKLLNKPMNWWRDNMSGDPNYINLMGALEPVRKEFEGFLLGGRALYGDDRKAAELILSDNASPKQLAAALQRMGHTAKARFDEENFRYQKVRHRDLPEPFSPEAIEGAKKIGISLPGGGSSSGSAALSLTHDGHVYTFPNTPEGKRNYQAMKTDLGIR